MREIRMLRSTWRNLETGDHLTAPDLDPTLEELRAEKFSVYSTLPPKIESVH